MIVAFIAGFLTSPVLIIALRAAAVRRRNTPRGAQLDKLGVILKLPRGEGERDRKYVRRLVEHARGKDQ